MNQQAVGCRTNGPATSSGHPSAQILQAGRFDRPTGSKKNSRRNKHDERKRSFASTASNTKINIAWGPDGPEEQHPKIVWDPDGQKNNH
jgi:hypothetical protein